jgi:hypothetical protein
MGVALKLFATNKFKLITGFKLGAAFNQWPDAQLRPGQVLEYGDWPANAVGCGVDALKVFGVLLKRTVREVKPCDVHTCGDHPHKHLRVARGWSDGGDNLG